MTQKDIEGVAVLGAGAMGHGIAQICAVAGCRVRLQDLDEAAVAGGVDRIRASLDKLVAKGRLDSAARDRAFAAVATTTSLDEACIDADLVIEAIPERMSLKLELFRTVDRAAPPHAILATNTSSLSVTELAGVTARPGLVVGMHFFNPVPLMELLEIVQGLRTTEQTIDDVRRFASRLGKRPIVVRDSPGFATSRLGVALGAEAIRMLEAGVASAQDIDLAMELGYRHPMGPLRLTDLVGLDVRLAVLEHLHREIGEQFRPPTLLRQMVRAGKLGRKSGEGFYKYE